MNHTGDQSPSLIAVRHPKRNAGRAYKFGNVPRISSRTLFVIPLSMFAPGTLVLSLLLLSYGCLGKLLTDPSQLVKRNYDFVVVGGE